MKIALAQINPTVGDLYANSHKIVAYAQQAYERGANLVVFPEFSVTGYPPLDLLENRTFIQAVQKTVTWIVHQIPRDLGIILGAPVPNPEPVGKRLYNAAFLYEGGERLAEVHKTLLPTYDVFDEYRYFEPAHERHVITWRGVKIGLHICEDMWNNEEQAAYHLYEDNPIDELAALGAELFINISASPFSIGKHNKRNELIAEICEEHGIPFILVNQVGANTEIIFDGDSRVHTADGTCVLCAPSFQESLLVWDSTADQEPSPLRHHDTEDLHDALVLGIADYVRKTGFERALVGLSGGIDSAVTCALAVQALGPDRVIGVTLPSRYSSSGSVKDSEALAEALGITLYHIPIEPAVRAFETMLKDIFEGTQPGIAEENIQARARGITLMAISNKFGHLLLSTGNKSETAVGYATLYGDMNGGLAVLSDVFKTRVYDLAEYINWRAGRQVIPENTITKPPSAELRPDQKDQDTLPPYPVLDEILRLYIEELREIDDIVNVTGFDRKLVLDVLTKVDRSEYKRRQAPPGLRVTSKAFGMGRRLPVVMRWNRDSVRDIVRRGDAALKG